MSELITTYQLSGPDQPMPMARDDFYSEQIKEFKENGKPTKSVEIAQILLFTPDLEVILQKRSINKNHNAGLMDKSIGGHVTWGDTPNFTVMSETLQELAVPAIVLDSREKFDRTIRLLHQFVNNTALIQFLDSQTTTLQKKFSNGELIGIANKYYFYLGVYGGSIKPQDKEASGILYYQYPTLLEEINKYPELFTDDLKYFLTKYSLEIDEFMKNVSHK
jgi:hypothetical protein